MPRLELRELPDPWRTTVADEVAASSAPVLRLAGALLLGATAVVARLAVDGFHGRAIVLALVAVGWLALLHLRPRGTPGLLTVVVVGAAIPLLAWSGIGRAPALVLVGAVFVAHAALVEWAPTPRWPGRDVPVAALSLLPLVASQVIWFRDERLSVVAVLLVTALAVVELHHRAASTMATIDRRFAAALVAVATGIGAVVLFASVTVLLYLPGTIGRAVDRWWRGRRRSSYWAPREGSDHDVVRDSPRPFSSAAPWERRVRNLVGGAAVVALVAVVAVLVVDRDQAQRELAELERSDIFERGQQVRFSELAAYEDVDWADDLKSEQDRFSNHHLVPAEVGGYDMADFEGRFTNVRDGARRTLDPPDCEGCRRVSAWIVGGSSAFGLGQRDEHTIASELVRLAAEDGVSLEMVNLGVPGWTIHQEAQKVLARLDRGEPAPDTVIFFNGYNDVVGTVMDSTVNGVRPDEPALMTTEVIRRFTGDSMDPWDVGTPDELGRLAADKWEREASAVESELAGRGIEAVFVVQPDALADPRQYSTVESVYEIDERVREHFDGSLEAFARSVDGRATVLRHLLDEGPPVFADLVHTNETGARAVARSIFEVVPWGQR